MSSYKLIIHPFAEIDLQVATKWYNTQKNKLGNEFIYEDDITLSRVVANPRQFPKIFKQIRCANVSRFPFSIFFVIKKNVINAFAIFHQSRNPVIWKDRLKK